MTTTCAMPHCRHEAVVGYIGRKLCAECWITIASCRSDEKQARLNEASLLAKIGLERNSEGIVESPAPRPPAKD